MRALRCPASRSLHALSFVPSAAGRFVRRAFGAASLAQSPAEGSIGRSTAARRQPSADTQDLDLASPCIGSERGFASQFREKYQRRLREETLMVNELYLSVIYRPAPGAATGLLSRLISKSHTAAGLAELSDAIDVCDKLALTLKVSLARYEPEPLGCYRYEKAWCSSLLRRRSAASAMPAASA